MHTWYRCASKVIGTHAASCIETPLPDARWVALCPPFLEVLMRGDSNGALAGE